MYFAHDPEKQFYYMGEVEPHPKLYKELLVDKSYNLISCDVETISLKERIAIGVGISLSPTISFYFVLFPEPSPATPWHLLRNPAINKIFHNSLFDLSALREYDVDTTGIMDTAIMSRLLCHKFNGLMELSYIHKMEIHEAKEYIPKAGTMLDVPQDVVARKCMQDSSATLKLFYEFYEDIDRNYLAVEMQVIPILIEMSNRGLRIDQEARAEIEVELQEQADFYLKICEDIGFSPGSPQQVSYTLAKRGAYSTFHKLPFTNRKRTQLSTDVATLRKMDDPLASVILKYRAYSKLLSTYIIPWAKEDRATTHFHMDAITGRPSSTDRNMQNIPGVRTEMEHGIPINCRNILLPDSGIWTDVDWEQLELRILAYLSQDKEMLHIYESGGDIHQYTAEFLNIDRKFAKNVNFSLIYGASDETIMETAGIRSIARARQLKESIFKLYPGVGDYISAVQADALRTHRAKTIFGRSIRLPDEDEDSIGGIQRKAVDYPNQASAAEILKRGLILLKDLPLSLQVHDEILVDGFIPDYRFKPLESIAPFNTPVDVQYLERWQ